MDIPESGWARIVFGGVFGLIGGVFLFGYKLSSYEARIHQLEEHCTEILKDLLKSKDEIEELKKIEVALAVITERLDNLAHIIEKKF